jgi:hypothetical protein
MAWAALIPVAMQLLKGSEEQQPQGPAMPPPPTIGELYKDNMQPVTPHTFPNSEPFKAGPVGGNRGY